MRTLKLPVPDDALPTLDTCLKQTKTARLFRREAVRAVVKGPRRQTVSDTLQFTSSALRPGGQRFASPGTQGLVDRPRAGRPPQRTCAFEQPLHRLIEPDPLQHGALYAQWSGRALAAVWAQQTGGQLGRERGRGVLKNTR